MVNGQVPWLTPFSQQDTPDLSWRSKGHEVKMGRLPRLNALLGTGFEPIGRIYKGEQWLIYAPLMLNLMFNPFPANMLL